LLTMMRGSSLPPLIEMSDHANDLPGMMFIPGSLMWRSAA